MHNAANTNRVDGSRLFVETHGMSRTPEYTAWEDMRQRCANARKFPNHAGRGIQVCDEWLGPCGFERFFDHVGPRPSGNHSLDRYPDKDGNYEPGNVRWATRIEQNNNTRRNHLLEYNGITLSVSRWEARLGWPRHLILSRLSRGWSVDEALSTTPTSKRQRLIDKIESRDRRILSFIHDHVSAHGYSPHLQEIADHCGFPSLWCVCDSLDRLEQKGMITRTQSVERNIKITCNHQPEAGSQ